MDINEITRIAELMQEFDLTEFMIESEELKLTLRRGAGAFGDYVPQPPAVHSTTGLPPEGTPAAPPDQDASAGEEVEAGTTINSPIVGIFYSTPGPDKPSYVNVGDEVTEDSVVCIVEAMKVMNEIKAETRGRIERVLVDNATPVEFGQPLFEITPL